MNYHGKLMESKCARKQVQWISGGMKQKMASQSTLNGERKFLTCTGSYVCNNPNCSKLTSEDVKNHNHFIQPKDGGYTCHSCGYYVQKEHCGAMKILEFDINTNYITAYHYGNHICWPKENKK